MAARDPLRFNRRDLLRAARVATLAGGGVVLAACSVAKAPSTANASKAAAQSSPAASSSSPGPPGVASSPVSLSMTRAWARRELYTLKIPQAKFDLSQSGLGSGKRSYTPVAIESTEIIPTYSAGAFVMAQTANSIMAQTHYRLFAMQPFATVEADFNITASVYGTGMIEWMSSDGTERITVSAKRHSGMIAAEMLVSGSSVASLNDTTADLTGDFTLIAQMQGRSVLVWHRKSFVTTYIGRLDFTSEIDLRDPTRFKTWTVGITARGHTDMQVRCSRFEANLSGNGHADPRIVAYEDGTPVQDGDTVWFLATTRGGNIPDAFQGVYALDVVSGKIAMTGALFGDRNRDGIWRNDNAGHLFYDRNAQKWTWFAIGHSDYPKPRNNWIGTSIVDLRHGINNVPVSEVSMPAGSNLWEDMYPVWDGTKWIAAASKDATNTAWLESTSGLVGPWTETRNAVGTNETGELLVRSGSHLYLVAGTGTAAYIVRDADVPAMTNLGTIDVDFDTGAARTWPALFALQQSHEIRWFMLSFDRTAPAGKYSYGRLHFYRQA
jgi:hypothetical protein